MQPPVPPGAGGVAYGPGPAAMPPPSFANLVPTHVRFLQITGIILGIMIFAGFLSFQAIFLVPVPCTTFGCPTLTPDQVAYENTIHALAWAGLVLLDLSVGLSVIIAFLVNAQSSVPETTRRSAFLFASIYTAAFTIFSIFLTSYLLSYLRYL